MKRLTDKINHYVYKEKYIYQMWNSIAPILRFKHVVDEKPIDGAIANMYKFDFEGLLINVYKIHKEFVYPTMIVNGYSSPTEYNGELKNILIVNDSVMNDYLKMFLRNLKEKNKLSLGK